MPLRHLIALIINAHPHSAAGRSSVARARSPRQQIDRRTLIRKTSLRDRSDGMRSSLPTWVSRVAHGVHCRSLPASAANITLATNADGGTAAMIDARTDLNLHDVRQHARTTPAAMHARNCFLADKPKAGTVLVKPAWWSQTGSNRRPPACKAGALPAELWPLQARMTEHERRGSKSLCCPSPAFRRPNWWAWIDSNDRPHPYQGCALTT